MPSVPALAGELGVLQGIGCKPLAEFPAPHTALCPSVPSPSPAVARLSRGALPSWAGTAVAFSSPPPALGSAYNPSLPELQMAGLQDAPKQHRMPPGILRFWFEFTAGFICCKSSCKSKPCSGALRRDPFKGSLKEQSGWGGRPVTQHRQFQVSQALHSEHLGGQG